MRTSLQAFSQVEGTALQRRDALRLLLQSAGRGTSFRAGSFNTARPFWGRVDMNDVRELIIIGGGPAGYTAALSAARANLAPLVIVGFQGGGRLVVCTGGEDAPGY